MKLAQIVATQIEQAEVLQPVSVLQVVHIGYLIVLQLHIHNVAVVGIVPQRIYVTDLMTNQVSYFSLSFNMLILNMLLPKTLE